MHEVTRILDPHNWIPANTQGGQIYIGQTQVAGVVRLTSLENHIYETETGDWLITSEGYKACNDVAGIQCFAPDSFMLPDGRIVGNPYIESDAKTGSAFRFIAKHVAIGKSPEGKVFISSATILFDAQVAFIEELSKAILKNKDVGRFYMDGQLTDEEKQFGIYRLFDGDLGVFADHRLPDVTTIVGNFVRNKCHGDKRVYTMARKAAIQRQPCMPHPKVKAVNGFADVLVGTYRTNFNGKEIDEMLAEYSLTGKVSGAIVEEVNADISKESDSEDFSLLSDGGARF